MNTRPVLDDFVGFESQPFAHDSHETSALYLFLYGLLVVGAIIVEVRWEAVKHFLPEAALMILVGLAVGGVVAACGGYATSSSTSSTTTSSTTPSAADDAFDTGFKASYLGFNSSVFFFAFLPPIIYSSGYHLKRRLFFVQIVPILSLAVLGTSISILATSLGLHLLMPYLSPASALSAIECVCFASLISSTDPVRYNRDSFFVCCVPIVPLTLVPPTSARVLAAPLPSSKPSKWTPTSFTLCSAKACWYGNHSRKPLSPPLSCVLPAH